MTMVWEVSHAFAAFAGEQSKTNDVTADAFHIAMYAPYSASEVDVTVLYR